MKPAPRIVIEKIAKTTRDILFASLYPGMKASSKDPESIRRFEEWQKRRMQTQ